MEIAKDLDFRKFTGYWSVETDQIRWHVTAIIIQQLVDFIIQLVNALAK